jgi:hypothetical protein
VSRVEFVELEAMRRLHNETLAELKAIEERVIPCAPEESAELIGRALRLQVRVKLLADAIVALAKKLGVEIVGARPEDFGEPASSTVH